MTSVDYSNSGAARQTINAGAEEKTKPKIRDLMPPGIPDELTRPVLTNAIHFRGS